MAILFFSDVLKKVGLDPTKVCLIRHAYSDKTFRECADSGKIYEYTCHQKIRFKGYNYDYWAVFISGQGTLAKLFALYKVGNYVSDTPDRVPAGVPELEASHYKGEGIVYDLEPVELLKEYEGKITIEWGSSARAWYQKGTTEKAIVSLIPDEKKVFMGYENVLLSFDQLKEIVENPAVYEPWHTALKSVYAIYLIVDTENGKQYVGSAYGVDGLFGRWECYVNTKHGNNKKMRKLICDYPDRYHAFQFSILQILPKTVVEDDVIKIENIWKKRLLSKEFGMNNN